MPADIHHLPAYRCPTCKKPVARDAEAFPFCTQRCKLIDLGRWASGEYSIPGEPVMIPESTSGDEL